MRLLLTSAGLTNESITNALIDLVGKKAGDISLVFIPTASNIEKGDKGWLIDDLINLKKQNFKSIDIVDISALKKKIWLEKFESADILIFGGGNTYHLMKWIKKSGLKKILPKLLKTKVFFGISAGSMVTSKNLGTDIEKNLYEEKSNLNKNMPGLNFINFYFLPHLNSSYFPKLNENVIKDMVKDIKEKIYIMDDNSALKIIDTKVEIISQGKYIILN